MFHILDDINNIRVWQRISQQNEIYEAAYVKYEYNVLHNKTNAIRTRAYYIAGWSPVVVMDNNMWSTQLEHTGLALHTSIDDYGDGRPLEYHINKYKDDEPSEYIINITLPEFVEGIVS